MTRPKILLLAILSVATALRVYALGAKSLWLDEVASIRHVRGSFGDMIHEVAGHDAHPPLYYALQYGARCFGAGEAAARVPSALAGIALAYIVYLIGRRLAGEAAGLFAAGLCAVSAFQIYFSQEARPYALAMLLAAVSFWLFLRIVDRARREANAPTGSPAGVATSHEKLSAGTVDWIAYTAVAAAMLYTYYYLAFALAAEGVVLLFSRREARLVFKKWLMSRAAAAVLFAPYLRVVLDRMSGVPAVVAMAIACK